MNLPWSAHVYLLLDIRTSGVGVEFASKDSAGNFTSLARTTLAGSVTYTGSSAVPKLITAVKEMLAKYPQFHPQECIVFLHSPHTTREHHDVKKSIPEQVITSAAVSTLLAELPKPEKKDGVLVHEYVAAYRVNGYQVMDPRGKKGTEFGMSVVRTYVGSELHTALVAPLESALGAPVHAASFLEMLSAVVALDVDGADDYALVEVEDEGTEYARVVHGEPRGPAEMLPFGMNQILREIEATSGVSSADLATSLPLLDSGTLEEARAKQVMQGVVSAAAMFSKRLPVEPYPVPMLFVVSDVHVVVGRLIAAQVPFARLLPPGDMPRMARMVGL